MDTFDHIPPQPNQEPAPMNPAPEPSADRFPPRSGEPDYAAASQEYAPPAPQAPEVPWNPVAESAPQEPFSYSYRHPQSQPYRMAKPRKESPYANAPYVMNTPQEEPWHYAPQQPPEKPRKEKKQKKQKKSGFWKTALASLLILALVAGSCFATASMMNTRLQQAQSSLTQLNQRVAQLEEQLAQSQNQLPAATPNGIPAATGEGLSPAQVYAQNVNSVVAISVTVESYTFGQVTEGESSGSGFILTEDGYVVTNHHVIEGATRISVVMNDNTELDATLVGSDSTNDLAVLKVEATGLPAVTLGSSSAMIVGDMVVAIGNPLGELNATQTVGYICGKDREVTTGGTIINMLQTDAAINPGNSGGPLFNMYGQVIGITTAKYSGTTSSGASIEGIGFAIPIDDVIGIISDLQSYGYVTGAYLGVTVQNLSEEVTSSTGISGARIIGVEPGYAADRAGLRENDIITALNGQQVTSITDLTRALRNFKAGDTVTMTIIREGLQRDVSLTLDEKPQQMPEATIPQGEMPSEGDYEEWFKFFYPDYGE